MTEEKKPNIFEILGPGKTFLAGFVTALLVFFSIGFFVLLAKSDMMEFSGGDDIVFGVDNQADSNANDSSEQEDDSATKGIDIAPVTSQDHVRGDLKKAQVVVVEFSDFDCPFCQRFHPTMQQILSDYGDKVAWVYRHFPLDSLHPNARKKAAASECVARLGGNDAFWKFTDALYDSSKGKIGLDDLPDIAVEAGVSKGEFQNCLDNGDTQDDVQADYQDAVTAGGRGTPYSVVMTRDGQKIPLSGALPVSDIKSVLDPLLK